MNKEKYFIDKVNELCNKFKIKIPLIKKSDKLGIFLAETIICSENNKIIKSKINYNLERIKELTKAEIIHVVLHEIGHIRISGSEYLAEKFAIKRIKKYYPQYYNEAIKEIEALVKYKISGYCKPFKKILEEENE